jgi:serine-type D-Ala-D-Ala carboxypeptidase/endopeptidase (penicillin-binding protein 4)
VRPRPVGRATTPAAAVLLAAHDSPPLAVLVRGMGKYSNNFVAEMVLKSVGAESRPRPPPAPGAAPAPPPPATWADGQTAVRRWLVDQVGLPAGSFRYDNGSGLFDATSFSPRQIAAVLRAVYRDFRIGPDFVASLATAGADGTLRSRLVGGAADHRVRAKTGTLDRVVALSGYAAASGTRPLAFSIVINDLAVKRGGTAKADARALVDEVAALLAAYAGAAG